jgi:peroxiredoxin
MASLHSAKGIARRSVMGLAGIAALSAAAFLTFEIAAKSVLEIGKLAPDFAGLDSNGKTVRLSDYKGKLVVLEWSNHECPYVRKHYSSSNMQALQRDATKDGVVWLTIVSSPKGEQGHVEGPKANELTQSRKAAPTAVLLDPKGEIARLYDARVTPHMFIVDKEGMLQYMGGIDDKATANVADIKDAKNYVRAALAELAKGQKVSEAVTRAYGCTVKYAD